MLGSGMVIVMASPYGHGNNVIYPIPAKTNTTRGITPSISNPNLILTSDINPIFACTNITLTATAVNFSPTNYKFYFGTQLEQSGSSNEIHWVNTLSNWNTRKSFMVKATDSEGTCLTNETTVYDFLPPSIAIHSSSGVSDISGRPVEFNTSYAPNGLAPLNETYPAYTIPVYTYNWWVNDNTVSTTGRYMNYTFNSAGNYTIEVEWSNTTGTLSNHFFQNYTEIVDPPLNDVVTSSNNPSDIGESVTYTVIPSGSTDNYTYYSYKLYSSDSNLSTVLYSGNTPSFSAILDSSGTYLIDYEVESSNGYFQNATLSQVVNSDPSVSISANKTTTDVGNPISLSVSPSGGTSPYSYSWLCSPNGTSSSYVQFASGNSPILNFAKEGTYYIIASLTDSAGFSVNSTTLSITVNPAFTAYISSNVGNKSLIGECMIFTLNCVGGSGQPGHLIYPVFVFSRSPNPGYYDVTSDSNQIGQAFHETGIWYAGAEMSDAAGSVVHVTYEFTVYSNNIRISFHPKQFEPVGVLVNLNASVSTTFSPPSISQISYIWTINGVNYSGNNYLYDFSTPGTYNITLTVEALASFTQWTSPPTTSTLTDQNKSYATVIASSPGNSTNIIINSKESPISGGVSFSWYSSFRNSSEYSYYILIQGDGASPTQIRMLSNGTLYIEENVYYSNYAAGSYSVTLIVYNNRSQSNQSTMGFTVSLSESNQVTLNTVIEWFGGLTNFIVVLGTVVGIGGTVWAIHANENPNVIIESGNGTQSKKILVKGKKIRGKK